MTKTKAAIDVTDYTRIIESIIKLEDGHTYIVKVPDKQTGQQITNIWNALDEKPKVKILLVPSDTEIYKSMAKEGTIDPSK